MKCIINGIQKKLELKIEMVFTAVVADMFLLVGELDVFVQHRPQGEPHLAVLAHEDLFRLSQVVVVKVHTQAARKCFIMTSAFKWTKQAKNY